MKEVVGAFNQEKALIGVFSVMTHLRVWTFVSSCTREAVRHDVVTAGQHRHRPGQQQQQGQQHHGDWLLGLDAVM